MDLEIRNSFCKLTGNIPPDARELIKTVLTYQNDIGAEKATCFYQMKLAKRFGNKEMYDRCVARLRQLEANEWVCWFKNDVFPTGLLNIVREALSVAGATYREVDHRIIPTNDHIFKWNNRPYDPRYYQRDAIGLCLQHGRGVIESAVGSGKSLMQAYVAKELAVTTLIVVPSSGLSDQIYNDFVSWFGSRNVQIIDTKAVRSGKDLKPIRIITIQSMASLQKSGELRDLVHDVNAIFIDEIHHAGSASYTNLLPDIDHIYYRFGFSGTFLRNDQKSLDMWGFLSNVLYRYPASKAIEDKFLTPIHVEVHSIEGKRGKYAKNPTKAYQAEYDANYCGNPDFLMKVRDILFGPAFGKQTLILVDKKDKSGKIFFEYLSQCGLSVAYIDGDNKKEEISQRIRDFNDKKIGILIGSKVIGEGIDVRSADHLIMAQGGKSEIAIVQATGRLVRLFEGKLVGHYHDFHFTGTKYLAKHLTRRMDIISHHFAPKRIIGFQF